MDVTLTIKVSGAVYTLYNEVAKRLGDYTAAEAMAGALEAYAMRLAEEMIIEEKNVHSNQILTLHKKEN